MSLDIPIKHATFLPLSALEYPATKVTAGHVGVCRTCANIALLADKHPRSTLNFWQSAVRTVEPPSWSTEATTADSHGPRTPPNVR